MPSMNSQNYFWFSSSGSIYDPSPNIDYTDLSGSNQTNASQWTTSRNPRHESALRYGRTGSVVTEVITESLTIKYFQRVYDTSNTQWCYYTKTEIDPDPGTSETVPANSGNIVSSSVIKKLEIY